MTYRNIIKPIIDFSFAFTAFTLLFPVIIIITIVLSISNSGTPFFTQTRPGKNGCMFKIIKFKTMNDKTNRDGKLLADEYRLTPIGKLVRKFSLDEIPQLLNIIKGDMSLIGPRPLLPEYLKLYSTEQARRHEVKPGITGWAQVNGRNELSWTDKFKLDVWYVKQQSFTLDFKIILMTVKKVLISEGITEEGKATTSKFKG